MKSTRARWAGRGTLDARLHRRGRTLSLAGEAGGTTYSSELSTSGNSGSCASTTTISLHDATALDIRWFGLPADFTPVGSDDCIISQRSTNQVAFTVMLTSLSELEWRINTNGGTSVTIQTARVLDPVPADGTHVGLRWTWSGTTYRYYTADDPDDPTGTAWTQVGADVTGTAANMVAGSPIRIGAGTGGTSNLFTGKTRQALIYKNAALVASPDFTGQIPGITSFKDGQDNTWTLNGDAAIVAQ